MATEAIAYHLRELEIARDPGAPGHILPPVADGAIVLDVGCGAGQTLIALGLARSSDAYGVDIDLSALTIGRRLERSLRLACATAEALPFRSGSFDTVVCRVALPYTHIPTGLAEIYRVLRPGGNVWLSLHPLSTVLHDLVSHARRLELRAAAFRLYVLINGLALHALGRQVRFPLGHRRCESFQTRNGIARALRRAGFSDVATRRDRFFVVTACKPVR